MPRQPRFSKEDIVAAGLKIVRASGYEAVSARALGKVLGSSSSPMFTVFKDMGEVMEAINRAAQDAFLEYMDGVTAYSPAFKEFGLRLVSFSKEKPNLFQLLFFGKDSHPEIAERIAKECLCKFEQGYELTGEQAELLFRQMWPVACGIAALSIKHPEDFPEETVSRTLSYHFVGILSIIQSGREIKDVKPQKKGLD